MAHTVDLEDIKLDSETEVEIKIPPSPSLLILEEWVVHQIAQVICSGVSSFVILPPTGSGMQAQLEFGM